MAIDQDTLNTLKNIERLLAGSSRTTTSGNTSQYSASQARAEQVSQDQQKKVYVSTGKAVDRLGYASNRAGESLIDFSRKTNVAGTGLGSLSTTVSKVIAQINASRAEMDKVNASNLANSISETDNIVSKSLNKTLIRLNQQTRLASSGMTKAFDDMKKARTDEGDSAKTFGKNMNMAINALERRGGVGAQFEILRRRLVNLNNAMRTTGSLVRNGGGGGGGGRSVQDPDFDDGGSGGGGGGGRNLSVPSSFAPRWLQRILNPFAAAGALAAGRIWSNVVKIFDQAWQTTGARGFGTFGDNFVTLSQNALMAGMSLQEYVKMLDKNEGTVSRFASFEAFDNELDKGRASLEKFGIFGEEATALSAAMVNSAQSLGVPVSDLGKSMNGQMRVFEELRKTTGITAEQFEELNRSMQDNEGIQRELIGLAPEDRAARLEQIQRTSTWGKALGLTTQASSQLTQALLAQRRTTVKDRFNARGRLSQSMSLVGMDAATIAEASALVSKRVKTPEEDRRLATILGQYSARSEEIMANGGEGMANAVEQTNENLNGTTLKPLLDASVNVKAAQDSGAQINKDMGKTMSDIDIKIGKAISLLDGLSRSPLVQLGAGILTLGFATLQLVQMRAIATLPGRIAAALRGSSGVAGSTIPDPNDPLGTNSKPAQKGGKWGRAKGFGRSVGRLGAKSLPFIGTGLATLMAVSDYKDAEKDANAEGGDGDVGKLKGEAIGMGIGTVAGGIIGAAIGSIIPVFGTAIGGAFGSLLGGWAGKLLGGWAGQETATEKNNRELKNNTDELIKARRSSKPSDVINSNLGGLSANVLASAKAFAPPSVEEIAKVQADLNKKNNTTQATAAPTNMVEETIYDPYTGLPMGTRMVPRGTSVAPKPTSAQQIATPVSPTPSSVNQAAVNTATTTLPTTAAASATTAAAAVAALPTQDQASILAQILQVLQQNLAAENTQIDLAGQMLRTANYGPRLPDNQLMVQRAIRTD